MRQSTALPRTIDEKCFENLRVMLDQQKHLKWLKFILSCRLNTVPTVKPRQIQGHVRFKKGGKSLRMCLKKQLIQLSIWNCHERVQLPRFTLNATPLKYIDRQQIFLVDSDSTYWPRDTIFVLGFNFQLPAWFCICTWFQDYFAKQIIYVEVKMRSPHLPKHSNDVFVRPGEEI